MNPEKLVRQAKEDILKMVENITKLTKSVAERKETVMLERRKKKEVIQVVITGLPKGSDLYYITKDLIGQGFCLKDVEVMKNKRGKLTNKYLVTLPSTEDGILHVTECLRRPVTIEKFIQNDDDREDRETVEETEQKEHIPVDDVCKEVIIKGLPKGTESDDVLKDLKEKGIRAFGVRALRNKRGGSKKLYSVKVFRSDYTIFLLTECVGHQVRVEDFVENREVPKTSISQEKRNASSPNLLPRIDYLGIHEKKQILMGFMMTALQAQEMYMLEWLANED